MATNKWRFYFKHLLLMSTNNKTRLILTSIGIFVAVFLFASGQIVAASYYSGSLRLVSEMRKDTVVISSNEPQGSVIGNYATMTDLIPVCLLNSAENKTILSVQMSESQYLNVIAHVHGISDMRSVAPIITQEGDMIPIAPAIIEGRALTTYDAQTQAQICVIDQLTAQLLFPDESAIGKKLQLDVGMGSVTIGKSNDKSEPIFLEVVGVTKNSYVAETNRQFLRKKLSSSTSDINIMTSLYTPITVVQNVLRDPEPQEIYLYAFGDKSQYDSFVSKARSFTDIATKRGQFYNMVTKEALLSSLESELASIKTLLNLISLLLCVISGISIMSIVFFSVKERIPEIGIRKAFGASQVDIAFQFMFEMVIIAFAVSVGAIAVSYIGCRFAENLLTEYLFMSFSISVSYDVILLPLFVGILEAVICSVVPAMYASRINVTESLRFE